ncbi:MAG: YicC/YloC family endoribonuclease [Rhizobiaceae bacterium]
MKLFSMTGFARQSGSVDTQHWTWELRSVNGKGLDIRLRLPLGYEHLEADVRKIANANLSRGNVQISLSLECDAQATYLTVNEAALGVVTNAIRSIDGELETALSSAAQILALRGVMETTEPLVADETKEAANAVLKAGFEEALDALAQHRASEGKALAGVLIAHIDTIEKLTAQAEADPSHTSEAILEKLGTQIGRLTTNDTALDPVRLHQEAALLATKADIREELDRLIAHCKAARDLIDTGSPVGRKLEFLSQEFNREANTLCSKSNAVSLTATGLELKAVIDQFREQILNVE